MSVHFRIVSDDGNTLLDRELAKASGRIDIPADDVLRVLELGERAHADVRNRRKSRTEAKAQAALRLVGSRRIV